MSNISGYAIFACFAFVVLLTLATGAGSSAHHK